MRTLGILGGMSYHSTIVYYKTINSHIQRKLGSPNSASIILHSFNYGEINSLFANKRWSDIAAKFINAANHMKSSGAEGLVIGCNIGHRVAGEVEAATGLPVLHISDATGQRLKRDGIRKAGLMGTKPVMEQDFIQARLKETGELYELLVPHSSQWDAMNGVIFGELAAGIVTDETRNWMRSHIKDLQSRGAESIILACTEFQFAVSAEELSIPIYDTLALHAEYSADWALGNV